MNRNEFHCRCCGACCRIKDGIVRVSDAEISRIAAYLGMGEAEFIANETELAPDRKGLVLKSRADGACVYLDENNLCRLNPVKPDKCRTFPFEWTNPDSNAICPELAGDGGSLDRINKINRIVGMDGCLNLVNPVNPV